MTPVSSNQSLLWKTGIDLTRDKGRKELEWNLPAEESKVLGMDAIISPFELLLVVF